uniref:Uncharacterized protein n=1 Tax=Arundo donax TaxID=35708 RepID=A0A0A9AF11_ARUDO
MLSPVVFAPELLVISGLHHVSAGARLLLKCVFSCLLSSLFFDCVCSMCLSLGVCELWL